MRDRYYQCQECEEIGTIGTAFTQVFKPKSAKVVHNCKPSGAKTKWIKNYVPENKRMQEVKDKHGVFVGSIVRVKGLEDEDVLKVIGVKPTPKTVWIEVWNPESKNSWIAPVESVTVV